MKLVPVLLIAAMSYFVYISKGKSDTQQQQQQDNPNVAAFTPSVQTDPVKEELVSDRQTAGKETPAVEAPAESVDEEYDGMGEVEEKVSSFGKPTGDAPATTAKLNVGMIKAVKQQHQAENNIIVQQTASTTESQSKVNESADGGVKVQVQDEGTVDDRGVLFPSIGDGLVMWDPVEIGYVRKLKLDETDNVYEMRTVSMDPPAFVIENFLSEADRLHILEQAEEQGLRKSCHLHLDGSNRDDKDLETHGLSLEEANKLFRHSDQTWLQHQKSPRLASMQARAARLARLPPRVVRQMEPLQVVKYDLHGHYECHYDSEPEKEFGPCCFDPVAREKRMRTGSAAFDLPLERRCRLCRFMTILYFLEETEKGGETVFPLAGLTDEEFKKWEENRYYKQTRHCGDTTGVVVPPKKYQALLWYNHDVDRGYLGKRLVKSLHGGCNVVEGIKWIANHWISDLEHPDVPRKAATRFSE
eukprot:m.17655 g.17655  ORF g.17655 m.17655 type:complete len:472 (+) comp7516_c0_seq2:114-1529(+)